MSKSISDEDLFMQGTSSTSKMKFKHLQPRWWHKLMFWRKEPKYGIVKPDGHIWVKLDKATIGEGIKINLGKNKGGYDE